MLPAVASVSEANSRDFLLFVSSGAPWAADACESAQQIVEGLVARFPDAKCAIVDADADAAQQEQLDALLTAYRVEAVPTLVAVRSRQCIVGVNAPDAVVSFFERELAGKTHEARQEPVGGLSLEERLKALIGEASLMLFIKGTPERPECGFTRQLMDLLAAHGLVHPVHFRTFNILADSQVRQGLKDLSQWPTYPQIYWQGELLGGLDILREMFATGQMDAILRELGVEDPSARNETE
jgi:Grx4 family monothiol glutaredoxin